MFNIMGNSLKFFDKNIKHDCIYCHNSILLDDSFICTANCFIIDEKCKKFKYDPLLREPRQNPKFLKYDPSDFLL